MFTKEELKRNLLGCLETALFMPAARQRFGNTQDEAVRSFLIPILLIPLTMTAVYFYPKPHMADASARAFALLYCFRMAMSWALFLGSVYWIVREVGRREHFCQFIIAMNWMSVPATLVFLPVAWILLTGGRTWHELYPAMMCTMIYTYIFTAYIAARILRVPWEMGGFIAVLAYMVNDYTGSLLHLIH